MRRRINTKQKLEFGDEVDNDSELPYGGKVLLAKKKKPDSWYILIFECLLILTSMSFCAYTYFYFDRVQFHANYFYAHLGYSNSQNLIGLKYLQGHGVEKNNSLAFHWLKQASDQGHPHASYNLAIGHFDGLHTHLQKDEDAHELIQHAARNGISKAKEILNSEKYETNSLR